MFNIFQWVSSKSGLPYDQTVCICLLLLGPIYSIPLKFMNSSSTIRKFYTIGLSFALHFLMYGTSMFGCLIPTAISYYFTKTVQRRFPFFVPVFFMSVVSISHIYKVLYHYGWYGMEVTASLMMFTAKISSFALNYSDGARIDK